MEAYMLATSPEFDTNSADGRERIVALAIEKLNLPSQFSRESLLNYLIDEYWAPTRIGVTDQLAGDAQSIRLICEIASIYNHCSFKAPDSDQWFPTNVYVEVLRPIGIALARDPAFLGRREVIDECCGQEMGVTAIMPLWQPIYCDILPAANNFKRVYYFQWRATSAPDGRPQLAMILDSFAPEQKVFHLAEEEVVGYRCCFPEPLGVRLVDWHSAEGEPKPLYILDRALDDGFGRIVDRERMNGGGDRQRIPFRFQDNLLGYFGIQEQADLVLVEYVGMFRNGETAAGLDEGDVRASLKLEYDPTSDNLEHWLAKCGTAHLLQCFDEVRRGYVDLYDREARSMYFARRPRVEGLR